MAVTDVHMGEKLATDLWECMEVLFVWKKHWEKKPVKTDDFAEYWADEGVKLYEAVFKGWGWFEMGSEKVQKSGA